MGNLQKISYISHLIVINRYISFIITRVDSDYTLIDGYYA